MQMHQEEEKNSASSFRFFHYESTLKLVMGKVLITSPIQKSKKKFDKYYVKKRQLLFKIHDCFF